MIKRIISGGQTGGDMAGLYAGQLLSLETGGWAPKNWMTEKGPQKQLLQSFGLAECDRPGYPPRTALNVRDSNGTVVFGKITSKGCALTMQMCHQYQKPNLHFDVPFNWNFPEAKKYLLEWLSRNKIEVLNVAGNRESSNPGIQVAACTFLVNVLVDQL